MKILIVDDSKTIRKILIRELGHLGVPQSCILEASNGSEGLEAIEYVSGIQLVFTDINMPEMGGIEFIRRIRAVHSASELAVLVVSSESSGKVVTEALELGANGYLTKPFHREQLKEWLACALS